MKSIRSKIFFGVFFLFAIILALSITDIIFINRLAQSAKGTIVDNYSTIEYTTQMISSLDEMYLNRLQFQVNLNANVSDSSLIINFNKARLKFEKSLSDELVNITEPGERLLVERLRIQYKLFLESFRESDNKNTSMLSKDYNEVKNLVNNIYSLNMNAVISKNSASVKNAEQITIYTIIFGGISIIITLFFIIMFPARIVKPVKDLTVKIKAVSRKDYNQKLDVNSNDEIGELAEAFNVMAERLKEYETQQLGEILTAKQRLEALVQNMQDGIIVLDNNNKIVLANQVIAELSGVKIENLMGKDVYEISTGNDLLKNIVDGLKSNSFYENSKNSLRIIKDKKEYFYEPENIPILTNSGDSLDRNMGSMIVLKNVTRFEERDVAKTRLISTVSHEMKTPVSSINLTVKLLEDSRIGKLNTEQKELVQAIKEQSNRLSRVINEILNYSQIETGNIRLNFTSAQPEDVIDYATTSLMILLSEKNIQLETEIEDDLPSLNIDIEKTVWVLVNLLSNAIRYSANGGKIILSANRDGDNVSFSVKDFGPGISPEDQKKLFGRFSQLGQRSERGWGLGLAISKEFVQAQGGRISVQSKPGEGSIFSFSIPLPL